MKEKSLILALLILVIAVAPVDAKQKYSNSKKLNPVQKNQKSGGIASDSFLNAGAWDWSNWQDVVADCEIFRFRKRMISSK